MDLYELIFRPAPPATVAPFPHVDPKTKAKRRAANKQARKSRRTNRRAS